MQKILNCFFRLFLLLLVVPAAYGQQQPPAQDSVQQEAPERLRSEWAPSALRVGVALSSIVNSLIDPQASGYGFQVDVPFRQLMLNVDYGRSTLDLVNSQSVNGDRNFTYSSQGTFFRAGLDINMLTDRQTNSNDAFADVIYFGIKYARSSLSDEVNFTPQDNNYTPSPVTQQNNNLNVWWLEMNAGVKIEVFSNVFMGYTLRYKFFKNYEDSSTLVPYRIPGFGPGSNNSAFGFDYYLYYRIPFRKKE